MKPSDISDKQNIKKKKRDDGSESFLYTSGGEQLLQIANIKHARTV